MDLQRDRLLARSAFPGDQHPRAIAPRHLVDAPQQGLDRGAVADDLAVPVPDVVLHHPPLRLVQSRLGVAVGEVADDLAVRGIILVVPVEVHGGVEKRVPVADCGQTAVFVQQRREVVGGDFEALAHGIGDAIAADKHRDLRQNRLSNGLRWRLRGNQAHGDASLRQFLQSLGQEIWIAGEADPEDDDLVPARAVVQEFGQAPRAHAENLAGLEMP